MEWVERAEGWTGGMGRGVDVWRGYKGQKGGRGGVDLGVTGWRGKRGRRRREGGEGRGVVEIWGSGRVGGVEGMEGWMGGVGRGDAFNDNLTLKPNSRHIN